MRALIQRVSSAAVTVAGAPVANIGNGLLALVGVQPADSQATAQRMAAKLCNYRVFSDAEGKMNASLLDTGGELLLVSQFTLAANTSKGLRPSFASAAAPEAAALLFDQLALAAREHVPNTRTGRFGANMQVSLVNDGPVTFLLEV